MSRVSVKRGRSLENLIESPVSRSCSPDIYLYSLPPIPQLSQCRSHVLSIDPPNFNLFQAHTEERRSTYSPLYNSLPNPIPQRI